MKGRDESNRGVSRGTLVGMTETKCLGCDKPATAPLGEPKFCKECWQSRWKQLGEARAKFRLQRTMRCAGAEQWYVSHPDSTKEYRVGEVFVFWQKRQEVCIELYVHPWLAWGDQVGVLLPNGMEHVETLFTALLEEITEFFVGGGGRWVMQVTYVEGKESELYEGEI